VALTDEPYTYVGGAFILDRGVMTRMQQSKKILEILWPKELSMTPEMTIESDLASTQNLRERWTKISRIPHDTFEFLESLRLFYPDFHHHWLLSSPTTLAYFGIEECYAIFEHSSKWKEIVWPLHILNLYNTLSDKVQLFRGGVGTIEEVLIGHSWTLDMDFAEPYATKKME
jgi:hypothetical protein